MGFKRRKHDAPQGVGSGGIFNTDSFGRLYPPGMADHAEFQQFHELMKQILYFDFPPDSYHYEERVERAVMSIDDEEVKDVRLGPDIVIKLKGDSAVQCVADAKAFHDSPLSRRGGQKVERYWALSPAEPPRIYVPEYCHIQSGARELVNGGRIQITPI